MAKKELSWQFISETGEKNIFWFKVRMTNILFFGPRRLVESRGITTLWLIGKARSCLGVAYQLKSATGWLTKN